MTSSLVARRGAPAALAAFAVSVLFLVGFTQGAAHAAETTKGSVVLAIPSGKAGKISALAPAKVSKRFGKKGAKVTSAAKGGTFGEKVATGLQAAGGLKLSNGKRSVKITSLKFAIDSKLAVVRGNVAGKKNVVVFTAGGKGSLSGDPGSVKFSSSKMQIPPKIAGLLARKLKLKKAPTGRLGALSVNASKESTTPVDPCVSNPNAEGCKPVDPCVANPNAEGCKPATITDPYLAQCNVAATSKVTGSLTPAAALPTLTSPQSITGLTTVGWGVKSSFRNYVVSPAAAGAVIGLDGATPTGTAPAYGNVNWTFVDGQYSDSGTPGDLSDDKAVFNLKGTALFCAGGHNFRVAISDPTVVIDGANSRIIASVDSNLDGVWTPSQRIDLATLNLGAGTTDPLEGGAKWTNATATLTADGGKAICGVGEPLCPYTAGTAMDSITVKAYTVEDQYSEQCGIPVAHKVEDAWTDASASPNLTDPLVTSEPTAIDWGYRSSFRGYVFGSPPAGTIQALDGASRSEGADPTRGFSFPVSEGKYSVNDLADTADDQAVIDGTGTGLFCKSGHGFWTSISDPTIIIDGANSRIVATISENLNGTTDTGAWNTPQRVDLASLDLSGITPIYNKSGSEVTWTNIPVTQLVPFSTYGNGAALDPITVTVKTPYDTGVGDAAAWDALATYVQTNLPFPNSTPNTGGCEVGVPAGGSATDARTIDEHASYGGTTSAWMPSPGPAAAVPALTGTSVTGGGLDWGFRSSLRGSVNATGDFNVAGGAAASVSNYYGNGGSLGMRDPGAPPAAGGMSGANYFTWPGTSGTYNPNGAGEADDQLILRAQGKVAFCQVQTAQRYGIIFSNPTVVIDGANSRLTYDVTTRYRLSWIRATVDFAKLDVSQATLTSNTNLGTVTKTWSFPSAAVTLTADGNKMARMLSSAYVENLALDAATIRASFPE